MDYDDFVLCGGLLVWIVVVWCCVVDRCVVMSWCWCYVVLYWCGLYCNVLVSCSVFFCIRICMDHDTTLVYTFPSLVDQ